jgi:hypothetical protein
MLSKRVYKPVDNEIIYHYCKPDAFLSICTQKNIRFSDLFTMNDYLEMHWGYSIWENAASELLSDLGFEYLDKVDEIIHQSGGLGLALATSFSTKGDVLSQWRAYAEDGKGYAIGFSVNAIYQMPVRWLKVLYDQIQQVEECKAAVKLFHDNQTSVQDRYGDTFIKAQLNLAIDLAALKNPAFAEEDEIRAIHLLNFQRSNDSRRLSDPGGIGFGEFIPGKPVSYRMRGSVPVAYNEEDFTNGGKTNPIKEVILGPKNDALPSGISIFLETIGLGSVKIKKSAASYR